MKLEITDHTKPDCDVEGSITVSGSGGTKPYSYSIDGVNFQSSTVFDGLAASTYTITIKDADECKKQASFNLQAGPNGITVNISSKTASDCLQATGSLVVSASGGDNNFTYSLDGESNQQSSTFKMIGTGNHSIRVTDGTGCTASISTYLESNVSLTDDIFPIIDTNCAISGCHNGTQFPNLTTSSGIRQHASQIKSETQAGTMPRDGFLSQNEIDLIACWVDDGAKDN
ncbi:MAG: hypothetical protein RLN88_07415 [Ekhidna sp.]|uniref:hypothetical protein n=1 Tax=Ekhidna sp. TaxID=2608089 RepID=UPI0032ECB1CE